jgi:hypothetical protein
LMAGYVSRDVDHVIRERMNLIGYLFSLLIIVSYNKNNIPGLWFTDKLLTYI